MYSYTFQLLGSRTRLPALCDGVHICLDNSCLGTFRSQTSVFLSQSDVNHVSLLKPCLRVCRRARPPKPSLSTWSLPWHISTQCPGRLSNREWVTINSVVPLPAIRWPLSFKLALIIDHFRHFHYLSLFVCYLESYTLKQNNSFRWACRHLQTHLESDPRKLTALDLRQKRMVWRQLVLERDDVWKYPLGSNLSYNSLYCVFSMD